MLEGFKSQAATFAADVDHALFINLVFSIILAFSVLGPMVYFAWKYRASNVKKEDIENVVHHTGLEITWTLIPTIMMFILFYYGYSSMKVLRTMPDAKDSITIHVEGSKWKWRFEYPANAQGIVHQTGGAYTKPLQDENGKVTKDGTMGKYALYVPVDTNIILKMTAPIDDVIHSFFIPAFRMKEDVVPGRTTQQWFKAEKLGEYDIECAEYCGTDHSYMFSKVVVLPKDVYKKWFESKADSPKGDFLTSGDAVLQRHGCKSCHAIGTDKTLVGPTLHTRRLTKEQVMDVIKHGQDKLGYAMGPMPADMATGKDVEVIADYVSGGMKGKQPAAFAACSSCHGADGKGQFGTAPNLVGYDAILLSHVLKHGKKGMIGKMPAFPYVTEKEASAIAEYLNK